MSEKISLIIPCKNEVESLGAVLNEVKNNEHVDEIIVVVDSEDDNSIPIINNFSIKTKTQIGLLFTSIISIILAYNFNEVIDIWYTSGSFAVSVLLLPILFYLYDKEFCYPLFNMICSLSITFGWFSYGMINKQFGYPIYPLNLEPMFPGLFTSIFIWITCDLFVRFNSSKK